MEIKVGQTIRYKGGQDDEGKSVYELQENTDYHVFSKVIGNFVDGQKECIYLKEVGMQCAFITTMFEVVD